MSKLLRSVKNGSTLPFNQNTLDRWPDMYEVVEDEPPKPKRRRRKKVEVKTDELDSRGCDTAES